jgi:hypothetical protein
VLPHVMFLPFASSGFLLCVAPFSPLRNAVLCDGTAVRSSALHRVVVTAIAGISREVPVSPYMSQIKLSSCRTGELDFHRGLLVGRRDGCFLLEATIPVSKVLDEAMRPRPGYQP